MSTNDDPRLDPMPIATEEPRKLMFATEVAKRWRLTTQTLAQWRARGIRPQWFRIGDNIRYFEDSVVDFERTRALEAEREAAAAREAAEQAAGASEGDGTDGGGT